MDLKTTTRAAPSIVVFDPFFELDSFISREKPLNNILLRYLLAFSAARTNWTQSIFKRELAELRF